MKIRTHKRLLVLTFALAFLSAGITNAQTATAWGYSTGYGNVYGSYGLASTMQSMYNVARAQAQRRNSRDEQVKKWGLAAVEKAEREASGPSSVKKSNPQIVVSPPPAARNYGVFRPDPAVDTGTALSDALGDTPEEKALIKQIYTATRAAYDKEAVARGWKNNIAAGLTFFTVSAMTVYHDGDEPGEEAVQTYYKVMNAALDEMPELAKAANKDKQGFNNTLVGFGGLLYSGYMEGKQNNDAATLAGYKKLAGILIELVLKTDPENVRVENGQIVLK